ncbi:MAG: hypothetical protein M3Y35_04815 [Actinomycetota bacterium]|nr:hypothetical protein [Actinomycetota bacterium]
MLVVGETLLCLLESSFGVGQRLLKVCRIQRCQLLSGLDGLADLDADRSHRSGDGERGTIGSGIGHRPRLLDLLGHRTGAGGGEPILRIRRLGAHDNDGDRSGDHHQRCEHGGAGSLAQPATGPCLGCNNFRCRSIIVSHR